ncbi:MAG: hypothetical protein JNM79_18205 [Burkholderiales bacterium]|nr:hypothetical protein [Burkholderiales bacterium]
MAARSPPSRNSRARRRLLLAAGAAAFAPAPAVAGRAIPVGPQRALRSLAAAAAQARDGDTIEVDAGDYAGDTSVWTHDRLVIRAVGGPVRLLASGQAAEEKAIWVVRGGAIRVEGIDFIGARVRDRNGAGIRLERGRLTLEECGFFDNENGILTSGHQASELVIERCRFGGNGAGDGQSHNLYVGAIGRLSVRASWFYGARVGHLLKSRALTSLIAYNRFVDGDDGHASYELEFPWGGMVRVLGNLIQQSATTQNSTMLSFGAEGYPRPANVLYACYNTFVDERPSGIALRVAAGADGILFANNLLAGNANLLTGGQGDLRDNPRLSRNEFHDPDRHDYRLRARSPWVGRAAPHADLEAAGMVPEREYVHPARSRLLPGRPLSPGALQSTA